MSKDVSKDEGSDFVRVNSKKAVKRKRDAESATEIVNGIEGIAISQVKSPNPV
jgi:hypothetical protein